MVHTDFSGLSTLSPGALAAFGILAAVQLVLLVSALIVLYRLPEERVRQLSRPVWTVVIVLANLVGPILFFTIGIGRGEAVDHRTSRAGSTEDVIAELYNPEG